VRGRGEHVLAGVEADYERPRPQLRRYRLNRVAAGVDEHSERPGDESRHLRPVRRDPQVDHPHPVGPPVADPRAQLGDHPRLAASAGAGERDHTALDHERLDDDQLGCPPDEASERQRKAVSRHTGHGNGDLLVQGGR
jgi:hypothetical protein